MMLTADRGSFQIFCAFDQGYVAVWTLEDLQIREAVEVRNQPHATQGLSAMPAAWRGFGFHLAFLVENAPGLRSKCRIVE